MRVENAIKALDSFSITYFFSVLNQPQIFHQSQGLQATNIHRTLELQLVRFSSLPPSLTLLFSYHAVNQIQQSWTSLMSLSSECVLKSAV